ncbi:glycerol-3-phosphate cytidylyltransferase [Sulfitobacter sp. D35]|uniref:glycerol-3-phosphate cytidylyltransferase n=1 Tax=Sulfitobacter sp. D35 TaxID=3083252 RepID=UPI00296F333F|nr:glycerol-3-phosphate cytidylyltransferase [Sulfitobacter sp. D35]MDW4497803.1 glycerol-3-phosphate cytidylyltransferase [Sulfitobacter sp. D35]
MTAFAARPIIPRRTILTYGRFDGFGAAEAALLKRLCCMGADLIVGCSTDEFADANGAPCRDGFRRRRETLEACRYVSRVIPETCWEQKRTDIVNYNVSIFAMTEDWRGAFDDLQDIVDVLYVPLGSSDPAMQPMGEYRHGTFN